MAKKTFNTTIVSTYVGEESSIKGALHSQRSIRVEGAIEGKINSQGEVYIGQNATVRANVIGHHVVVAEQHRDRLARFDPELRHVVEHLVRDGADQDDRTAEAV